VTAHNDQVITSGALLVTSDAVAGTAQFRGKWAFKASDGAAHISATASVPATARFDGGQAFSTAGALYTTTDAPDSTTVYRGGIAVRGDGATHITTDAVAGTDVYIGGIAFTQTGVMKTV
jgi:hypothetical protein